MTELVRTQRMLRNDQRVEVEKIAAESKSSFSEVVRQYIDAQLHQHKFELMKLAADLLASDYQKGGCLDMKELEGQDFLDV